MVSIENLKKQRDALLKKRTSVSLQTQKEREQKMEKRKLEAEIKSLQNPRSAVARKNFLDISKRAGSFFVERAKIVGRNAVFLAEQKRKRDEEEEKKEKAKKKRKGKKNKKYPSLWDYYRLDKIKNYIKLEYVDFVWQKKENQQLGTYT